MSKLDIYKLVTQRIIELLESKIIPWQIPWKTVGGMPRNLITQKPYKGINFWLLLSRNDAIPQYLTFSQTKSLGGTIRKGEKSTLVVFWKLIESDRPEEEINKKVPLLRYYNVFNISQTEGIDESKIPKAEVLENVFTPVEAAELVITNWSDCPKIIHGGDSAYYDPRGDLVRLPSSNNFFNNHQFYATLFHELVHSTGHFSRLDRHSSMKDHRFGSRDYSKEELIAEMGAAYLCGLTDIQQKTIENNAAYIQSWIKKFKDDSTVLIFAAAQAQKAIDYITRNNSE